MEKILVSACLLGAKVRYHGGSETLADPMVQRWEGEGRIVCFCPEVAAGLPTPRPRAEVRRLDAGCAPGGLVTVMTDGGTDVTATFTTGAQLALALVKSQQIRVAILKDGSPSCGSSFVYDGTFSGARVAGQGVTTAVLEAAGVRVFNETQIADAAAWLAELERHVSESSVDVTGSRSFSFPRRG